MESTAELEAMFVCCIMGIPPIIGLLRNIRNEPEPQNIPLKPFPTFRLAFDDAIEKSYKFIQFIFGSKIISSHLFVSSFLINLLVVLIFMAFGIINDAMKGYNFLHILFAQFGVSSFFSYFDFGISSFVFNGIFVTIISLLFSFIYFAKSKYIIDFIHSINLSFAVPALLIGFLFDIFITAVIFLFVENTIMWVAVLLSWKISEPNFEMPISISQCTYVTLSHCDFSVTDSIDRNDIFNLYIGMAKALFYGILSIFHRISLVRIGIFDQAYTAKMCIDEANKLLALGKIHPPSRFECHNNYYSYMSYPLVLIINVFVLTNIVFIWFLSSIIINIIHNMINISKYSLHLFYIIKKRWIKIEIYIFLFITIGAYIFFFVTGFRLLYRLLLIT